MKITRNFILAGSLLVFCSAIIDLNNLFNYAGQGHPNYIVKDNTPAGNAISNGGATLGRVLFYDKKLSANNTISCASCHKQAFAFGDTAKLSLGLHGQNTIRHAMRLVNARFAVEQKFFWDERVASLEIQTTKPIADHLEMGYSGLGGDPPIDSLIQKLQALSYYQTLFQNVYGSPQITEAKIQKALAQFIRSIQSFDSRFDQGLTQTGNVGAPFPNFTAQENLGKALFLQPPPQGAGCNGCHAVSEFDIDPNTRNNGIIQVAADSTQLDLNNTRAPSLRDLINPNGQPNGPMMHNGKFKQVLSVINHYNSVPQNPANTNLDPRLQGPGGQLQLTQAEKEALAAFLKTLTGVAVYTAEQWSDPFDAQGNITVTPLLSGIKEEKLTETVFFFPNPSNDWIQLKAPVGEYQLSAFDAQGSLLLETTLTNQDKLDVREFPQGMVFIKLYNPNSHRASFTRIVINRDL
ncbi:MAG: T9SS type A sorting domain-containing protein [Bacteroidia bacterium]|nr:T9SS type A sorting domain-containing protein [Bacteroidia bacterium]